MKIRLINVAVALAVFPAVLLAQDNPVPATTPLEAAGDAEATGVTGEKGKEIVSVDVPNAEIRSILRNIADLFDLNLVIPETLEGRASLKLRDVTWRQIFDVLLQPVDYTYVTDGNIIKIVSRESLNIEPPETRIFILNYSRASEIAATINSMIDPSKGGKMQLETRNNALVVTERPKQLEKIGDVIVRLDRATSQVMIETKFVEVTNRDMKDIGINWASLQNYGIGTDGPVTSSAASVTDLGSPPTSSTYGTPPRIDTPATAASLGTSLRSMFYSPQVVTATFSADQFRTVLSALQTLNETRLVSNPTVVTLNNQEAVISIGEQFPVPSYTYNQERGTFEVSGFEYKDIGIIMKVTPQVNSAGLITLKIDPEVSSRSGTTTFGGEGGAQIPIISTRRTSTQVSMKDGFTMGIGGLIESTDEDSVSKVPLLGDIPGIGGLFRHKSKNNTKRNLIVFITARILPPEEADYHDVFSADKLEKMGITEADIPMAPGASK